MLTASECRVLVLVPNLLCYLRLALLMCAVRLWTAGLSGEAVLVYIVSALLDAVDGWTARRLGQCSEFGAWLDVVVDNTSRGWLWHQLAPYGWLPATLEWLCYACNSGGGGAWKARVLADGPWLCRRVMARHFRQPWGVWAIAGLHALPIWLVGTRAGLWGSYLWFVPRALLPLGLTVLVSGRLVCACVELWCIWAHVSSMLHQDAVNRAKKP